MLKALWEEEKDPADPATLAALIGDVGLDAGTVMTLGAEPRWLERRAADTKAALDRGVFGAPTFFARGEMFWGNDRLDDALAYAAQATDP